MEINKLERNGYTILFNIAQRLIQSSHEDITMDELNAKIRRLFQSVYLLIPYIFYSLLMLAVWLFYSNIMDN